jgi:hypothetical protein
MPLAGCGLFARAELDRSKCFATTEPTLVRVAYKPGGVGAEVSPAVVRIIALSAVPDLALTAYQLDYLDQAGLPLEALSQPRRGLEPPLVMPPPVEPAVFARVELPVSPVTRAVEDHGKALVALSQGRHCITCRVTLFGRRGAAGDVELVAHVPVCFEDAQATPASAWPRARTSTAASP